jgi:predicted ferric reductase
MRAVLIWTGLGLVLAVPVVLAALSPQLAWRGPIYIAAGLAGVAGLALMVLQPLLAAGFLPGMSPRQGRVIHRWTGISLLALVVAHIAGLWITSPPDVIDALTFTSATPFAVWGVLAMWALFLAAPQALMRRKLPPALWRLGHSGLVAVAVIATVVHALLITGTMETVTKVAASLCAILATAAALWRLRAWAGLWRRMKTSQGS